MRNPTMIGAGTPGGDGGIGKAFPTYGLNGDAIDVVEGTPVRFTVLLTGADTLGGGVDWAVATGTPADFGGSLPFGHATFTPGATGFPVSLPTTGNAVVDGTRPFTVVLSNPDAGGVLAALHGLAGTIQDDDTGSDWALHPNWTLVATTHVESGAPGTTGLTQTAQGVTLREEASGTTGAIVELWWKKAFPAADDFTFQAEYTRTGMPGTTRVFSVFWDVVGDGTAGFPASVPGWTALVQANPTHATGTFLVVDQETNRAQLFAFDKAAVAQVGSNFTLTLTQDVVYVVKVQRVGTTVTLTVTDKVAGTSVANSWTDAKVKRGTADGYFGLRGRGVLATIQNNTLTDDGNVVVPVGWGTAPRSVRIASWETARVAAETATLTEGADETVGVRLTGGAKDAVDPNDPHSGQRAISQVSLLQVVPPGTLKFDYKPLSTWAAETPNTSNGVFSQADFYALNSGTGDLSALGTLSAGEWTANYSPTDNYYNNGGTSPARAIGGRLSFDTHSLTGVGDNQFRWRFILADGTIPPAIGGAQTFDFRTPGGWSTVEILLDPANGKVVVTVTFSDGSVVVETIADARIGSVFGTTERNVALMVYNGRDAQFRNVSWTPGGGGGGGGGGGAKAPFYVPNLAGKTAFPIANDAALTTWLGKPAATYATQYGLVAKGVTLPARTVTTAATKTNPCYVIAERNNASDHEDFTGRATVTGLTFGATAKFVWYDGFVHKPGGLNCVTIVGDDSFVTRGWFRRTTSTNGVFVDTKPSLRTRIGCCLFDSDGGTGNTGDINQYFRQVVANNPDYWDTYGNAHVSILSVDQGSGMCLYAQPGYDSGDPAVTPPTLLNLSQPHSFWRGCHIRNNSKFGVYAKHIPNYVECDGAFMANGVVTGNSHVFAFRGGTSVGGRMLRVRAQCLPFTSITDSGSRQALALQSWYHEVGWCEAVGGCINIYCFCPQHDAAGNVTFGGPGEKPLQQARYCDIHHNKGLLILGATRTNSTFLPEGKLQNVVVAAHEGEIRDDAFNPVIFNGTTGQITSPHPWIETSGPNACKIFFVDPKGRPARPASLSVPRNQAGPGCPNTTPWDGVGQWPKIEDYGSTPYV